MKTITDIVNRILRHDKYIKSQNRRILELEEKVSALSKRLNTLEAKDTINEIANKVTLRGY